MSTVLLTGGTGTLGRAVDAQLTTNGFDVRTLSRRPRPDDVSATRWATADLRRNTGLEEAVTGVDVVVHCATGRDDVAASRNLINAIRAYGDTPHLVYISIVGVDDIPLFYYRAKRDVEDLVASAELPWTILRATQFHDLVVRLFASQRGLPLLLAPEFSFQPIDVRDVAERITEIVGQPAAGRVPDIGGPEVRTASDLARAYLDAVKLRRKLVGFSLPGKTFAGYRAGHNLIPENAVGTITYEQFLAETSVRHS
ncbi:SDR family oxidoreductase [Skermania sp. ID1734]|uniref:SDR family oxidoreductase n=1 Tax=Skermania sp. ID1734 TaxID=2597516 RepID=UPI002107C200|nr:SDR family oxidoreductase [Skermania sp. ID1734]